MTDRARKRRFWTVVGSWVIVGLAVRLCVLLVRYYYGDVGTRRPHIESTALILALAGLAFRTATHAPAPWPAIWSPRISPRGTWAVMCALSIALYWPALSVGFLSDDLVLARHALDWRLEALSAELFRPLPLAVWALVLHAGGGAPALHLLNVMLHGTNSYLAMRVVGRWLPKQFPMVAAGLLVLTLPIGPEAVAWNAGVFDAAATVLILSSILIARTYGHETRVLRRAAFISAALVAVLSKETAVIGPGLVLLDAWAGRAISRKLIHDVALTTAMIAVFSVLRLVSTFGVTTPALSRFRLQRLLFDSFGYLAVPWHSEIVHAIPLAPTLSAISVVCLLTAFFLSRGSRDSTRIAIAGAVWILVSLVPVGPVFFVAPDLQGTRYLYLAGIGWTAIVLSAAGAVSRARRFGLVLAVCIIGSTITAGAVGVRLHLRHWRDAARLRDAVALAAANDTSMKRCEVVKVSNLPDSVHGAYVFRVGAREVLASVGVNAFVEHEPGPCSFRWDSLQSTFLPLPR